MWCGVCSCGGGRGVCVCVHVVCASVFVLLFVWGQVVNVTAITVILILL